MVARDMADKQAGNGGRKLVVVILTRGAADDKTLLPSVGKHLLAELRE